MNKTASSALFIAFLISLSVIAYLLFERASLNSSELTNQPQSNTNSIASNSSVVASPSTDEIHLSHRSDLSRSNFESTDLDTVLGQLSQLEQDSYANQIAQLTEWLQIWPYESALLMALGKIQGELGYFEAAAGHLYEALQYAQTPEQQRHARTLLFYTLNRYAKDLSLSDNDLGLETLYLQYQDTILEQGAWGSLAKEHGNLLFKTGRFQELEYFIQDWSNILDAKKDLKQLENKLVLGQSAANTSQKAIPLEKRGSQFIVSVLINGKEVNLLIDTGASHTVLTIEAYQRLSVAMNPKEMREQSFNTAGGKIDGVLMSPVTIQIGEFEVRDTSVALLSFEASYDGLLGMNFLSRFDFEIDQQGHLLFLKLPD